VEFARGEGEGVDFSVVENSGGFGAFFVELVSDGGGVFGKAVCFAGAKYGRELSELRELVGLEVFRKGMSELGGDLRRDLVMLDASGHHLEPMVGADGDLVVLETRLCCHGIDGVHSSIAVEEPSATFEDA